VPFLVFDENRFAWTAVNSLMPSTRRPGTDDAPQLLYLYGPAGTGKSHLCDLLLRDAELNLPAGSVVHLAAADFAEQVSEEGDGSDINGLLAELTQRRLVVLSDIQHLRRYNTVQKRLATTLDELRRSGTSIVMTSVSAPGELTGFQTRLVNRLRGGICAAVQLPGPKSRQSLLQHFCSHLQIALPIPIIRLFARELAVSPRELLGLLLRFEDLARERRAIPDAALARAFLRQEIQPQQTTIDQIAKAVARHFGVQLAEMKSQARDQMIASSRQCAMYLARQLTGEHYRLIGEYFGGRSHSTVLHSCSRIASQLAEDAGLRQQLRRIEQGLRST